MKKGLSTYICYRQEESWELAKLIKKAFEREKFEIYLDEKDRSGYTQKQLDKEINDHLKNDDIVLIIISRNTLDGCINNEKDWMYQEIEYAIKNNKIIIPIVNDTIFNIPENLPKLFSNLNNYNAVFLNEKHLENGMANIFKFIVEEEYKFLKNPERRDIPRINNPKYSLGDIKKMSEEEIDAEVEKLRQQDGTNQFDLDKKIYNEVFDKYKRMNVLQLGCGNGFFAQQILKAKEEEWINKGKEPQINYIGIDVDPNKIAIAKKLFEDNPRYHFYTLNLFDENCKKQLRELCKLPDEDGNLKEVKFDVIICRFLLNNFEDPGKVIELLKGMLNDKPELDFGYLKVQINEKLKSLVIAEQSPEKYQEIFDKASHKPVSPFDYESARKKSTNKSTKFDPSTDPCLSLSNAFDLMERVRSTCVDCCGSILKKIKAISTGTIIITELDDGLDLYSPDKTGLFSQFYSLLYRSPKSGNRYTGRGVYGWLYEARYSNIQLQNLVLNEPKMDIDSPTSSIISPDERIKRFTTTYDKLLKQYRELINDEKTKLNKFYNQAYYWLEMNRDTLIYELKNPDFFYTTSYIIWTATK